MTNIFYSWSNENSANFSFSDLQRKKLNTKKVCSCPFHSCSKQWISKDNLKHLSALAIHLPQAVNWDITSWCKNTHILEYKCMHTNTHMSQIYYIACNTGVMILVPKPEGIVTFISCYHPLPSTFLLGVS